MDMLTSYNGLGFEDAGSWEPGVIPARCLAERGWRLDEVHAQLVSIPNDLGPPLNQCAIGPLKYPLVRWRGQQFNMIPGTMSGAIAGTTSPDKGCGIISERWSLVGLGLAVAGDGEPVYVMGPQPVTLVEYLIGYTFVWRRDEQG